MRRRESHAGISHAANANTQQEFIYNTEGPGNLPAQIGDSTVAYVAERSIERWTKGENYFLKANPLEAEEVFDWEATWNTLYRFRYDPEQQLNISTRHQRWMRWEAHTRQWATDKQGQYYFIQEWKWKNITDDPYFSDPYQNWISPTGQNLGVRTLYDFAFAWEASININNRSQGFNGQGGKGDDIHIWNNDTKLLIQQDGNYKLSDEDDKFDWVNAKGPGGVGEYMAPGNAAMGITVEHTYARRCKSCTGRMGDQMAQSWSGN